MGDDASDELDIVDLAVAVAHNMDTDVISVEL